VESLQDSRFGYQETQGKNLYENNESNTAIFMNSSRNHNLYYFDRTKIDLHFQAYALYRTSPEKAIEIWEAIEDYQSLKNILKDFEYEENPQSILKIYSILSARYPQEYMLGYSETARQIQSDLEESAAGLIHLIEIYPNSPLIIPWKRELANNLFMQEKYREAHSLYGELLEIHSDDYWSLIGYGQTNYILNNDLHRASAALMKAIDLSPEVGNAYAALADIHFAENNLEQALSMYEKAIEVNPENSTWLEKELLVEEALYGSANR
jgi:tetratricopeptide (TPR) repeat protein